MWSFPFHLCFNNLSSIERDFADRALCWESLAKRCWRMKPESEFGKGCGHYFIFYLLKDYHMKTEEIYRRGLENVKGNERCTCWNATFINQLKYLLPDDS